jgi:hypothetical protein
MKLSGSGKFDQEDEPVGFLGFCSKHLRDTAFNAAMSIKHCMV